MAYFGGSKAEQANTHGLLEVTSPEMALTGNDVMKSRDRKLRYNRMYVLRIPALFVLP